MSSAIAIPRYGVKNVDSLTQKQLNELVSVTAECLHIKYPSIIEKDYYVTQVIHSLSGIENEYFRLVFAGGTCFSKSSQNSKAYV